MQWVDRQLPPEYPLQVKIFPLLLLPFITSCVVKPPPSAPPLVPGDPSAPSQVTPQESLAIAQEISNHPWRPFSNNIKHAEDKAGIRVNTPDIGHEPGLKRQGWWVPGNVNTGIPYKWGGFDDLTSFDQAIANGLAGGDVATPEKRRADNAAVSSQAAGIDCSGFVSRCLKLPAVHDTTQLPTVCTPLAGWADVRPGDVLNIPHRHVILCAGWASPDHTWLYYYETGGPPDYWKPGLKQAPLEKLAALGYQPLRYCGMAREVVAAGGDAKAVLTRGVKATAASVTEPTVGEP